MPVTIAISVSYPPLPEGFNQDPDGFLTWQSENAIFTVDGSFLQGQINGAAPTGNVGVWFDGRDIWTYNTVTAVYELINTVPVGAILDYCGLLLPQYYLECDGSYILRATYPELFAAMGTTFDKSTDSDITKFRLPDLRGRIGVGEGRGDYNANGAGTFIGTMINRIFGSYFGRESSYYQDPAGFSQPAPSLYKLNGASLTLSGAAQYLTTVPPAVAVKKIIRYK